MIPRKTRFRGLIMRALTLGTLLSCLFSIAHAKEPWRDLDPANTLVIDTTRGRIVIEMRPEFAPNAVARIKTLAREHIYDGLLFHRVLDHFVDQTGNPNNHDGGVSRYPNLQPEFKTSFRIDELGTIVTSGPAGITGFMGATPFQASADPLRPGAWRAWITYCDGVAGMGRQADLGSANSEIFLMRAPSLLLDHDFTAWGRVVVGLDVVRAIAPGEPPAHPDRMIRAQVMADMPAASRPRMRVIDTGSVRFKALVAEERLRRGADFSLCDVPVAVE
jgi:peptidylprolyl isomerase